MLVYLFFNWVLSLVHLLQNRLLIRSIDWAFLVKLFFGIEAFHWFGAIWVKNRLLLILLLVNRNLLFFGILVGNLLLLVQRSLIWRVDLLRTVCLGCCALTMRIGIFLLRNVRMLLIFITLFVFIGHHFVFVIISCLLHFLLHIWGEYRIFCQNFFFCHL